MSDTITSDTATALLRATIDFALIGLKTITLVNGAAVVGVLTFVGHVWAANPASGAQLARAFYWPLASFLAGLSFALLTTLLAYITQVIIGEIGGGAMTPVAVRLRYVAVGCGSASLGLFITGSFTALSVIAS